MLEARKLTYELVRIAQELDDPWLLAQANRSAASIHLSLGEFGQAYEKWQQVGAFFTSAEFSGNLNSSWTEYYAVQAYLVNLSLTLWFLGYADRARVCGESACKSCGRQMAVLTRQYTDSTPRWFYRELGQVEKVQKLGEGMQTLGARYELPLSIYSGAICQGWLLARQGKLADGIAQMVQGIDGFRQMGNTLYQTWRLGTLADLYLQAQRPEEAEAALQEAFSISETSHEHRWDAELYRLRGKLALARGEFATQAEHDYVQALGTGPHPTGEDAGTARRHRLGPTLGQTEKSQ